MLFRTLIRPLLFAFPMETSVSVFLRSSKLLCRILPLAPLLRLTLKKKGKRFNREVFGLHFPNPVGTAAGLDRNADFVDLFSDFGFGFVEIGSLTTRPEAGSPRFGHPNKGVRNAISNLTFRTRNAESLPIGINIAAQESSSTESELTGDFRSAFALVYDFADYFVINLTDPLRDLTAGIQSDTDLMSDIVDEILDMRLCYDVYKPILLKISSDLSTDILDEIVDYARMAGVDGIVTGGPKDREEPALERTLQTVRYIHTRTKGRLPIIAGGGILSPKDAKEAFTAGASLVEVYSAFWHRGPKVAKKTLKLL